MVSGGDIDRMGRATNDPVERGRNVGSGCVARCEYQLRIGRNSRRDRQAAYGKTRKSAGTMFPYIG